MTTADRGCHLDTTNYTDFRFETPSRRADPVQAIRNRLSARPGRA